MNTELLETTARGLVASGKGILAADESAGTANKRFAAAGVEQTEENRRQYRQLLLTTPTAKDVLSGVIFFDETFWQNTDNGPLTGASTELGRTSPVQGKPFHEFCAENGIMPGIKVDEGVVDLPGFPGEKISKGLDFLPERILKYRDAGAKFAKWRSVTTIGSASSLQVATPEGARLPTEECINANAFVLARYARICQDADIVPVVEPEVLFDGSHTAKECEDVIARVLECLFVVMRAYRVHLPGAILKTSMVLPGKESGVRIDSEDVSERTSRVLLEYVPAELGGVVFLSGGQTSFDAFNNLNAIAKKGQYPWGVTFSYSRALQDPVLKHWAAHRNDIAGAKEIFAGQLAMASAASLGKLDKNITADSFVSQGQDV